MRRQCLSRRRPGRRVQGTQWTHFPIVRGSAIDGPGQSAGDTRNPFRIIELEVVARDGIEPSTRGFSAARRAPSGHDPAEVSLRPSKAPSIAAPTTPCRTAPPRAGNEPPTSATAAQARVTQVTALYTR
jgi:hypothetical protein